MRVVLIILSLVAYVRGAGGPFQSIYGFRINGPLGYASVQSYADNYRYNFDVSQKHLTGDSYHKQRGGLGYASGYGYGSPAPAAAPVPVPAPNVPYQEHHPAGFGDAPGYHHAAGWHDGHTVPYGGPAGLHGGPAGLHGGHTGLHGGWQGGHQAGWDAGQGGWYAGPSFDASRYKPGYGAAARPDLVNHGVYGAGLRKVHHPGYDLGLGQFGHHGLHHGLHHNIPPPGVKYYGPNGWA